MIQHLNGFFGVKFAVTVKIANQLFFLGIHGNYGLTCSEIPALELSDVFKLRIAFRMLFERFLFLRLTTDKAMLFQELTNNSTTHFEAGSIESTGYFRLP